MIEVRKKLLTIVISCITLALCSLLFVACSKDETFTVSYTATDGGYVCCIDEYGDTAVRDVRFTVKSGGAVAKVAAVPDEGYEFVKWTDGVTTPERKDVDITKDMKVTAIFDPIVRQYKLNYKLNSDSEFNKSPLSLRYGELDGVKLPVLQKEHFTFGGWYYDGEQIADENGNLLIDDKFLEETPKKDLAGIDIVDVTAKWTAKESFEFKILVIYVTKINADLEDRDGKKRHIDFEMSDLQRQVCHKNTQMLKREMDAMTDGLVDFRIDEYFTTQTVYTESFVQGADNPGSRFFQTMLYPSFIPEVREKSLLDGYDATVSAFAFFGDLPTSDEAGMFNAPSGSALPLLKGECQVHLDPKFSHFRIDGATSLAQVLDGKFDDHWFDYAETYVHEIMHTIEVRLNLFDYHTVIKIWNNYITNGAFENKGGAYDRYIIMNKSYYLNEFMHEGKREGIPYGFWKREIATVKYEIAIDEDRCSNMGRIALKEYNNRYADQGAIQEVVHGCDAWAIEAVPHPGYRFVRWSDGMTTPERQDRNITADFTTTAIFEPIVYTVKIVASEGGVLHRLGSDEVQGSITLQVPYNKSTGWIYPVAQEGYRFVGWSDGTIDDPWDLFIQVTDMDKFDENDTYVVTAFFEKIE